MKKVFNQYSLVLKKELKDAFRDKKSIFATFVLPILLFPLLFFIMGLGSEDLTEKVVNPKITIVEKVTNVHYSAESDVFKKFTDDIFSLSPEMQVTYVECEDFKDALVEGEISIALLISQNFLADINNPANIVQVDIIYDDRSSSGSASAEYMNELLQIYSQVVLSQNLSAIDPSLVVQPVVGEPKSLSVAYDIKRYGTDSSFLHLIIPMLLTMLISIGGASIATDLVAGEKERNTFESLLSTSASRFSILSAKYTVIIIFSFLSAIAEVVSIVISMLMSKGIFSSSMISSIYLPIDGIILVVFNLLMLAALFSGLLLILTSTSNTLKEAQSKSTLVMFLPMIIAVATLYVDIFDVSIWTMFVPIYNVIISIKLLLAGAMNYLYLWCSLAINIVYAILSVIVTMKSFSKEKLITK